MSNYLYINSSLTIQQNVDIYDTSYNISPSNYDYILDINLAAATNNLSQLFLNASFKQSSAIQNVDVNLTLNNSSTL
jgi:hypothetical protein